MNVVELSVAQDDRIKSAAMMAINDFMIEFDFRKYEYDYKRSKPVIVGYAVIV